MRQFLINFVVIVSLITTSCSGPRTAGSSRKEDGKIDVDFIQVNDVYEIEPLEGGKSGGMARVATLKKQYLKANPNTYLVMAGDFLSPSVYNSLRLGNKAVRGKQMVDAMNAARMDIAIFGNHEFDINENELQERLNESQFKVISSNSFHKKGNEVVPFEKISSAGSEQVPETYIMSVSDADGTKARIGFIGLTLPFNKAAYVSYTDPMATAERLYNRIKDSCDAVVAITHQQVEDDSVLAQKIPGLAVILGGHEHDMRFKKIGNVYITKAHANARSAYAVRLSINKRLHTTDVTPGLKMLDESIPLDSAVNGIVKKWIAIADSNYSSHGFNAKEVVLASGDSLDGRETEIRSRPTNFSKIIVASIKQALPAADVAIINAGSVRVDDILFPPVTQYDIIRSLPFGGSVMEVDMKGRLLEKILETGRKNAGLGGFLHYSPEVIYNDTSGKWQLNNEPFEADKEYKVAITSFLMTGGEANMDFLTPNNADIIKVYPAVKDVSDPGSDVRLAIIQYMEKMK